MPTIWAMVLASGLVDNIILWDGNTDPSTGGWVPPEGITMVEQTEATGTAIIGGQWNGTTFEPPPGSAPENWNS